MTGKTAMKRMGVGLALAEMDVRGEIGGIRELIRDYIVHVKGGVIRPECDGNWRITGFS